jgi:tryptophanyl-tRNA synthetase
MSIEQMVADVKAAEAVLKELEDIGTHTVRSGLQWSLSVNSKLVKPNILDQKCKDDLADALENYKKRLQDSIDHAKKKFEAIDAILEK